MRQLSYIAPGTVRWEEAPWERADEAIVADRLKPVFVREVEAP